MANESVTTLKLKEMKADGDMIVGLTAWDFNSAVFADTAGVDIVLVGDSLAMTIRGDVDTLAITMDDMLYHTRMVAKGCRKAMVIGDMPFMSYQVNPDQALVNAGRFLKEGSAKGVKIEGGRIMESTIAKITEAGIPVMGHIGLTPQSIHQLGGFKVQGRDLESAKDLVRDALSLEDAGVFALVLECVPSQLAAHITKTIGIPTIGIGAGSDCDGQIQVTADVIGLTKDFIPKHAKRYTNLSRAVMTALRKYVKEVKTEEFPKEENSFDASPEVESYIESENT